MPCEYCANFDGMCKICDGTGWIEPDYEAEELENSLEMGYEYEQQEYYEEPEYYAWL